MKRFAVIPVIAFAMVANAGLAVAQQAPQPAAVAPKQTVKTETQEHPRIARAIRELEDAIRYMEAAPHDFGGHKAKAIQDSRAAVVQLREAMKYRAQKDNAAAAKK